MVFYFLIFIVFLAELIISISLILRLLKVSRFLRIYSGFFEDAKPEIKSLSQIAKRFSEKMLSSAPCIVEKIKLFALKILDSQLKSLLSWLTFMIVKREVERHLNT